MLVSGPREQSFAADNAPRGPVGSARDGSNPTSNRQPIMTAEAARFTPSRSSRRPGTPNLWRFRWHAVTSVMDHLVRGWPGFWLTAAVVLRWSL